MIVQPGSDRFRIMMRNGVSVKQFVFYINLEFRDFTGNICVFRIISILSYHVFSNFIDINECLCIFKKDYCFNLHINVYRLSILMSMKLILHQNFYIYLIYNFSNFFIYLILCVCVYIHTLLPVHIFSDYCALLRMGFV